MKHETHNPHEERHDEAASSAQAASGSPHVDASEASVPTQPAPEPVHRWLDGEAVADSDLHAPEAEKHVQFWAKVNQETERRHRVLTPRGLDAIIMEKLETPVVKGD